MLLTEKTPDLSKSKRDFYSTLDPITWCCRVSGIFPLRLEGPPGKRKYSTNYLSMIYGVTVLALSITGLSMWTNRIDETVIEDSDRRVSMASIHLEFILHTSSMVVIAVTVVLTREKFADAIDTLSSQDTILHKLGTRLDYTADLEQNCIRMGANMLVMVVLFASHLFHESEIYLRYPLIWIGWIYPNAVRIVNICLFADLLLALRCRFIAINEHLRNMTRETKYLLPKVHNQTYFIKFLTGSRFCRLLYNDQTVSAPNSVSERLRSIAKVHGALYEATLSVNKIFGLNIIMGVVCVLKGVTTSMYHITREFKFRIDISWIKILGYFNWGMISLTHTVYLVTVCHSAQYQANLTGKLIHKFRIHQVDTPLNAVAQSLSLQLYHEKIEFSAAGVFPLDATLLHSIIGTTTTFLMILIQFQTSPQESTESQTQNNSLGYL